MNGHTYPLTATTDKKDVMKMYGSFTAGGKSYQIAMGVPGPGRLKLATGGKVYDLAVPRPGGPAGGAPAGNGAPQGTAADNPLNTNTPAAPAPAAPAAPATPAGT